MPKILTDCIKKIKAKGHDEDAAWGICISTLKKAGRIRYDKEKKDWVEVNEQMNISERMQKLAGINEAERLAGKEQSKLKGISIIPQRHYNPNEGFWISVVHLKSGRKIHVPAFKWPLKSKQAKAGIDAFNKQFGDIDWTINVEELEKNKDLIRRRLINFKW